MKQLKKYQLIAKRNRIRKSKKKFSPVLDQDRKKSEIAFEIPEGFEQSDSYISSLLIPEINTSKKIKLTYYQKFKFFFLNLFKIIRG